MVDLLLIPYMAVTSRMNGGKYPIDLPWGLDAWVLALPYILLYPTIGWWVIPSYFGAVVGIRLAHGRGFNYHLPFKEGSTPEKVEYLIPKCLSVPIQKFLIMFLTGLSVCLITSIVLAAHGHWIYALILALSGAAKGLAYFLPMTEWAEYARGAFLGMGLFIVL